MIGTAPAYPPVPIMNAITIAAIGFLAAPWQPDPTYPQFPRVEVIASYLDRIDEDQKRLEPILKIAGGEIDRDKRWLFPLGGQCPWWARRHYERYLANAYCRRAFVVAANFTGREAWRTPQSREFWAECYRYEFGDEWFARGLFPIPPFHFDSAGSSVP